MTKAMKMKDIKDRVAEVEAKEKNLSTILQNLTLRHLMSLLAKRDFKLQDRI